MDIYNLKSFQEKVARFSVSPYAEAITTLAGLSPQVVSIASRLASAYASLRGTVQLLTTDEDNKIIDETTEARETIARSAIVNAWNSMGSAVERLISLRRSLAGDGVTKSFPRTPINYTAGKSFAGAIIPCIVPNDTDMKPNGFNIVLPKTWANYAPVGPGKRYVTLTLLADFPFLNKSVFKNPTPGAVFNDRSTEVISAGDVKIENYRPFKFVLELTTSSPQPIATNLYFLTGGLDASDKPFYFWEKFDGSLTFSEEDHYYFAGTDAFRYSNTTTGEVKTLMQFIGNSASAAPSTWIQRQTEFEFPAASDQYETFDPLDPYEVFTQAYQAADAVLALMEEMGYQSGLSTEDRALLSNN